LEAAIGNAEEARRVVFDLFQDLDDFRLDDYKPFADLDSSMERLVRFLSTALRDAGHDWAELGGAVYEARFQDGRVVKLTTNREMAKDQPDVGLIGLDHPVVQNLLQRLQNFPPEGIGASVQSPNGSPGTVSLWNVQSHGKAGETRSGLQPIAVDGSGQRQPALERSLDQVFEMPGAVPAGTADERLNLLRESIEPMLQREVLQRGIAAGRTGFSSEIIGWIEVS
jgi:hypothetical protein